MITFETSVRVARPIEEVFASVSDPPLFPRWNSAVQTVIGTSGETGELGSTFSMQREVPMGRVRTGGMGACDGSGCEAAATTKP